AVSLPQLSRISTPRTTTSTQTTTYLLLVNPERKPQQWRTTRARSSISTFRASAAPPTASSRPRTTPPSRSPSPRLTRTAAPSPARTTSTPSPVSFVRWARATMPSTVWPSAMASSRLSGPASAKC
ncbi:hypothetical protein CABS02_09508, partial [Colletotrichum abscissum]